MLKNLANLAKIIQDIGIDGVKLIFNQKLSLAAHNVKQLQMIMGMRNGVPVTAVFGAGDIQQFCGTADGICLFFIQAVMTSAHRKPHKKFWILEILILYCNLLLCAIPVLHLGMEK